MTSGKLKFPLLTQIGGNRVTSPLVQRLTSAIQTEVEPSARACLSAELACYLARVGEFETADTLRAELRRDFGDGRNVRVSIWIMCIEALLTYFKHLDAGARDRMARANLLAVAANDRRLTAITSAWMAHIDFNQNRYESMAKAASMSLSSIDLDNHVAECRVSIVLGDAFLYCNLAEQSAIWYGRAHAAATALGDHAAIGALTYNKAALRVANARLQSITSPVSYADVELIRSEVNSAINYQRIAQLQSLDHLLDSARVGVLVLLSKFSEAEIIIDELLRGNQLAMNSAQALLLQADKALCVASQGRSAEAGRLLLSFPLAQLPSLQPDDRSQIVASLFQASDRSHQGSELLPYELELRNATIEHKSNMDRLVRLLSDFER